MSKPLALLCVHGVGHQEADPQFEASWREAITAALRAHDPGAQPEIDFLHYDEIFDHAPLDAATYAKAMAQLLKSAVVHSIGDLFERTRGLSERVGWTAGMVAQWSTEPVLRGRTRTALLAQLKAKPYDAVLGHSLGSLICYDTFVRNPQAASGKVFVSLGSQIGNPAVRDVFAGRLQPLEGRHWYHLFNPDDHVMTCEISLASDRFRQVEVPFDLPGDPLNHDATAYLCHRNAVETVWRELAGGPTPRAFANVARGLARATAKPTRRALLVGINEYPDPASRLEGCVNDVFLMSSVLQESGFDAEDIRVVLDDRATTKGILERLHWLLDGVREGDERMLYYSGHGAQIPGYGAKDEPDRVDECLVPWDFDWTPQHAILDRQFCELYSQLPYESHFVAVFDCCHSGGITRDGGPRIRGLEPPDDIRHRALRWVPREQMWVPRDFPVANESLAAGKDGRNYLGANGATYRLGRAASLRTLPNREYDATRKALGHHGPYLPILLEACQEQELSYEYRHGATSYGAYTFCLAQVLRTHRARGANPTFAELSEEVTQKLRRLAYNQTPVLVGAKHRIAQPIPWSAGAQPAAKKKAASRRPARK
jgi:hypothetical protein